MVKESSTNNFNRTEVLARCPVTFTLEKIGGRWKPLILWQLQAGKMRYNEIRKALPHFDLLHGVDNPDVARQMDRIAAELGLFPRVLLEVNVSGEKTKFGFDPETLRARWEELLALPRVQVCGLMTMAPYDEDPEKSRPYFAKLRGLREELETRAGVPLPDLSMGMSGDFEAAIAEGATMVRVGSAIFGDRPAGNA